MEAQLPKTVTGIAGLDEITQGGLPQGRPILVCGGPGCGKTLLGLEFLVRGATQFHEPGVFMAFEETAEELAQNVASLGFDLNGLIEARQLRVDYVQLDYEQVREAGDYSLDGLFIRLASAIEAIGAKRLVIDTLEVLYAGFANTTILRAELRRLFRWLKERGVTTIITAERSDTALSRYGLEEYVSDCVILLNHRVVDHNAIRHIRVVKYRGSAHHTDEFPFIINEHGFSVLPVTLAGLSYPASREFISSGVEQLDDMLGGQGYYRGSSVLLSGTAGTGKTSLAAHFAEAAFRRGERCLYFAFEEAPSQIVRNMASIGLNLQQGIDRGLLRFRAARTTEHSLEMHLALMVKAIEEYKPHVVVLDPVTNFRITGTSFEIKGMLTRLVDFLKKRQITGLMTSLTPGGGLSEQSDADVSSLVDTWLLLRNLEISGERNRGLYILKARGMAHSNQIREFILTSHGVELIEPYLGPAGVLTGSARIAQEALDRAEQLVRRQEMERLQFGLERKRQLFNARVSALQAEFEAEVQELEVSIRQGELKEQGLQIDRTAIAHSRGVERIPA